MSLWWQDFQEYFLSKNKTDDKKRYPSLSQPSAILKGYDIAFYISLKIINFLIIINSHYLLTTVAGYNSGMLASENGCMLILYRCIIHFTQNLPFLNFKNSPLASERLHNSLIYSSMKKQGVEGVTAPGTQIEGEGIVSKSEIKI